MHQENKKGKELIAQVMSGKRIKTKISIISIIETMAIGKIDQCKESKDHLVTEYAQIKNEKKQLQITH
jgi:hypothetical protein